VFAVVGYPLAHFFDSDGMFFYFTRHVESRYVNIAYFWTILSAVLLYILNVSAGSSRNLLSFVRKQSSNGIVSPALLWVCVITLSIALNAYFFVRMGYSLPLLNLPDNVTELLMRRIEVKERLNPVLFSLNATVLGPLSLILAIFFMEKRRQQVLIASAVNFLIVGSFSLAKSSFVIGVVIVFLAYSFVRPLRIRNVVKMGVLFFALLIPMFVITSSKQAPHVRGEALAEIVSARIFYGQWAALPYFFELFDRDTQPAAVLKPPYLSDGDAWSRNGIEVPARKVMRAVTGYQNLEGTGSGVAVTYFIGEAFAVGGRLGVILGCFLVGLEIWLLTFLFKSLGKTPLTIYLYSWFIYKICMGLITGLSSFVFSSFTIALIGLGALVALSRFLTIWSTFRPGIRNAVIKSFNLDCDKLSLKRISATEG